MTSTNPSSKLGTYIGSGSMVLLALIALYFYGAIVVNNNQEQAAAVNAHEVKIRAGYSTSAEHFFGAVDDSESPDSNQPASTHGSQTDIYNPNTAAALWSQNNPTSSQ